MKHTWVHIGDTHLAPGDRSGTKRQALEQILTEGSRLERLAGWLWPGDLAHSRLSTDDLNYLSDYVQRLTDFAPLVLLPGNHDLPGSLDVLAKLKTQWPVYLATRPETLIVRTATGRQAAVFAFPYPSRGPLVALGTPSEMVPEVARQALDVIFMAAAAQMQATGLLMRLAIAHVNVAGALTSVGQPSIGKEIELDPAVIQRLGPIPFLANHIHRAQTISAVQYAGSICGMDFGEIEEKSYVVLDMDDEGTWSTSTRPLDVPKLVHVEGELTRERFDWKIPGDSLMLYSPPDNGPAPAFDCTGCEVRVRFRYAAADKAALNFDLVKAPFHNAIRVQLDPIAEHTRALRAPEVSAAQTLEEKAAAFVRASGMAWTPSLDAKVALLLSPDGTAFLTNLETSLSGAVPPISTASSSPPTGSPLVPDNEPAGVCQ